MILAFMRVGKPILMLGVLAVSLGWSLGLITLTVGHLSIFSVMFISIVVGIGIDYGIYFLFRYEEEIFLGRNLREALQLTAARTGPGMAIGALTAGGTFFVLMLTDFRGIQELGFIAGTSILLAWLSMMTLFPAVLVLVDRRHADRPRGQKPRAHQLERIHVPVLDQLTSYPAAVLVVVVIATALSIWALPSSSAIAPKLSVATRVTVPEAEAEAYDAPCAASASVSHDHPTSARAGSVIISRSISARA